MRQLVFLGPGEVGWHDIPEPRLAGDLEAIVEPIAVATCDLDVLMLRGTLTPFPGPFPLGHEGVARVVEVGESVSSVSPGDVVVVPFQISCGTCAACSAGRTGNCVAVAQGSMYGLEPYGGPWGGFLADRVRVPYADAMLVRLGDSVDPVAVASLSDNVPDAWRTVGPPLSDAPGSEVLIVGGGGSVALYAVQIATVLGAAKVHYLDLDEQSLAIAERLGANVIDGPIPRQLGPYFVTVDASMNPDGLGCALRSTAPDGICTSVGIYTEDTALPLFEMYLNVVTFRTGRSHARPAIPGLIDLVSAGQLRPEQVTTRVVGLQDAVAALADPPRKLIIVRDGSIGS